MISGPESSAVENGRRASTGEAPGESIFFREWLASGRHPSVVSISSVCNNRCIFCSNGLNPFPIQTGIFRDVEDTKHQLSLMEVHESPIYMSESLPGRIAEGEAFLHPRLFDILALIRRKFIGNRLYFTTNGSMLDEPFLKELSRFRPLEINLSLHSTRPDLWASIFGRSEKIATVVLHALDLIKKYRFDLAGSIVTLPRICGWEDIENTFEYLVSCGAAHMFLWWPGYTVMTPPEIVTQVECPMEEYLSFAGRMQAKQRATIWLQPDMSQPCRVPVKRIAGHTLKGNLRTMGGPYRRVLWLTSEAAYPPLKKSVQGLAAHFPNSHVLFPVRNRTYAGNIICAGLLMVEDFILAGQKALEQWPDVDLILVPATPFDRLGRDLRKTPAMRIREELNRPVWLMDPERGSFDSLLDVPMVRGGDAGLKALIEIMNLFNRGRDDGNQLESALDLVDAYPVGTSRGYLSRAELRENLRCAGADSPGHNRLLSRRFETMDGARALCIESWSTGTQDVVTRWTFLVKRENVWKIERIMENEPAQ